jgi:acylphosphatase
VTARHLLISGRVQGVGFRDWLVAEAERRGVHGWVRNRRDGCVEALLHGEDAVVADLLRVCRDGPRHAAVAGIIEAAADPPGAAGFIRLPTA